MALSASVLALTRRLGLLPHLGGRNIFVKVGHSRRRGYVAADDASCGRLLPENWRYASISSIYKPQ